MASSLRRGTRYIPEALRQATQIRLSNVPKTAKASDIRRLVRNAQARGVESVAIEYERFEPTGRALLQLTHPQYLHFNLENLEKPSVSGVHVLAEPCARKPTPSNPYGVGLDSELGSRGQDVVLWGFPKNFRPAMLDVLLKDFRVLRGQDYIFSVPPPPKAFATVSRFRVRLESPSEAHRLVRRLHMTKTTRDGSDYLIRARVIY